MKNKIAFVFFTVLFMSLAWVFPTKVWAEENKEMTLLTVDQVDQLEISGAKYRLEKKENDTYVIVLDSDDLVVGANGYLFSDLSDGQYRLTETKSPKGYNLINEAITFEVNENGIVLLKTSNNARIIEDDGTYQLIVSNEIGNISRLPSTGGNGIMPYKITGISMIMLALVGMFFHQRKQHCN